MKAINGWIVIDKRNKPIIETMQDYEEISKMSANLHFDKQWHQLESKGFKCKKVKIYVIEQ